MTTYAWSCLACGAVNAKASVECAICGCSAQPTYGQVAASRTQHRLRGGQVATGAGLIREPGELGAYEVLIAPVLRVLFGMNPVQHRSSTSPQRWPWLLVLAVAAFALAYSVLRWGWPPVGFEASGYVALLAVLVGGTCLVSLVGLALTRLYRRARPAVTKNEV
jgi:hypothetical protein